MPCDSSACTLSVDGTMREFFVDIPNDYDSSRPYPVVFLFHPLGGNASQARTMYGIREDWPDAIYVSPDGIDDGWANTGGRDIAFVNAMMEDLEAQYCIDTSRYFSTGFSYGGIMSFAIMCNMADRFRAIAPMAGTNFGGSCSPNGPLAAWIAHGSADTVVDPDGAAQMRDILVELNGCDSTSSPVEPSPCLAYDNCDSGYPVIWCLNEGQGHAIPNYSSGAISEFFQQF